MNGKAAIAKILKQEGTEYLFCFPANSLIDACAAEEIRPILTRTERTLINMADGYTRVSNGRRNGVAVVQQGPGSENAFSGVAQAYSDGVPLLFMPGGESRRAVGVPPRFEALPSYGSVTKWAATVNFADRIPALMRRAFTLLRNGRTAPVLLEVPTDVMSEECGDTLTYTPPRAARSAADPSDVSEAARILCQAQRPVLHVGQGALYAEAMDELRELAELVQAPVLTTMAGKSAFPENHPLALGATGHTGTKMAGDFLQQADVVFGIGCSFTRTVFAAPIPAGKTLVQVTHDEMDLNKDYAVDHAVVGDAKLALRQLIDAVRDQGGAASAEKARQMAEAVRTAKSAWLGEWMPKLTSEEAPLNPYRVIWDLQNTVDRAQTIITHDSGNPRDQLLPFWETPAPRGYIGWGKSTQLGSSLGLAMGAKLAAPEKLVINVIGDTGFGMCGMDLETAARLEIPILVVLLNNSAMGGYEKHIPIATERYGTKFLTGDYTRVAEGLGAYAARVTQPGEIIPAIQRAVAQTREGRPALLEFITREEGAFSKPW
jgi:acetolactate synthase-1/2/3 large subunit